MCRFCCRSLFEAWGTNSPSHGRGDRTIMWGTTSFYDELTRDFGDAFEATSVDDCRLFSGKLVARHFGTFAILSANRKHFKRRGIRAVANTASILPPIREQRFAIVPESPDRHPTS